MATITGTITNESGEALPSSIIRCELRKPAIGYNGNAVVKRGIAATADGSGDVEFDLEPGEYDVYFFVQLNAEAINKVERVTRGTVPADDEEMTLEEFLDDTTGNITPTVLQQAIAARDDAQAAAASVEGAVENAVSRTGLIGLENYGGTAAAATADTDSNVGEVTIGAGFAINYRPTATNPAGDPTLAINGGDPYPIRDNGNEELEAEALVVGRAYPLRLTGAIENRRWEIFSNAVTLAEINAKIEISDVQPWATRAAFIAANIVAPKIKDSFIVNGRVLDVIADASGEIGPTADGRMWSPANSPHLWHYITNATPGTTNITEAVRKLLTFCTETGQVASFEGVGFGLIDTDAEITFSCSIEGGLIIVGNEEATIANPVAADVTKMLIIEDEDTPLVTGTVTTGGATLTQSNLAIGSHTPTADYFAGPGFARFQMDGVQIPNRERASAGTATEDWDQSVWVNKDGNCVHPMAVDGSASTSVDYQYRAVPASGWITISGVAIDMDSFNHCQVFTHSRNCVEFNTMQALPGSSPPADSCNRIIYTEDAAMLTVNGFLSTEQEPGGDGGGTYFYRARGAAEIRLNGVYAQEGWGSIATDQMNGFYVNDSVLGRVDTHGLSGNFEINNTTLAEHGITYGAFFGFLRGTDLTLYSCSAVYARADYGGYCYGDISITGKTNYMSNGGRAIIVDHETNPIGVEGFDLPLAYSITVGQITVSQANDNASGTTLCPWALAVETDCDVYVPHSMIFEGAKGFKTRIEMPLAFADLQRWDTDDDASLADEPIPVLKISDMIGARTPAAVDDGLFFPANTVTGAGDFTFDLLIDGCKNFLVDLGDYSGAQIKTNSNEFYRLNTSDRVISTDDEFLAAELDGGETEALAGGSGSIFRDPLVTGDNWDFSNATAIKGMIVENSPSNLILPTELTLRQAYSGWQADVLEVEEWEFTLEDDTFKAIAMPYFNGSGNHFYTVDIIGDRPNAYGRLTFRGGSDAHYEDNLGGAYTLATPGTVLNGTTGNDTDITISTYTDAGVIYLAIENRKGGQEQQRVKLINDVR